MLSLIAIHLCLADTTCQMNIYQIYPWIIKNNYRFLNAYSGNVNKFYKHFINNPQAKAHVIKTTCGLTKLGLLT